MSHSLFVSYYFFILEIDWSIIMSGQNSKPHHAEPLLSRIIPFAYELKELNGGSLKADFMAALAVVPVALPQVMAYAVIAGIPAQYGLYAMTFAVIAAALWGSSRFLVAGPTNAISTILFATVAQASIGGVLLADLPINELMPIIFCIALFAGLIQVFMGVIKLGSLTNFISHSVMVGFSTGAALLIVSGQLKNLFQLDVGGANFFKSIVATINNIHYFNPWSLFLGILSIIVVIYCKKKSSRIPAYLAAVAVTSFVAYVLDLQSKGVEFVASIPSGLPPLSMPNLWDFDVLREIINPALAIAMLGAVESLTVAKDLAVKSKGISLDANKELIGQGLGNIVSGFTSGIPGCGSFSRSALSYSCGAKSRFAAVFVGLITLPSIVFFAPLADNIPMASLAGILIFIAWGMIDKHAIRLCLVATRVDKAVFIVTVLAALVFDLERAVFLGVLVSLVLLVYKEAKPRLIRVNKNEIHVEEFKWVKDYPSLEVFFVEGTLFFGAVASLEEQLMHEDAQTKVIVLNLSRVFWVDGTGAHSLGRFAEHCKDKGIELIIIVPDESIRGVFERTKSFTAYGKNIVHSDITEALAFVHALFSSHVEKNNELA